jgi:hypothetical protein
MTWSLSADLGAVEKAAAGWGTLARLFESTAANLTRAAGRVGPWEGETAESYRAHRRRLVADLRLAAFTAKTIAEETALAAGQVRATQRLLSQGLATLSDVPRHTDLGGLVFAPANEAQEVRVRTAVAAADQARGWLDRVLAGSRSVLAEATAELVAITGRWPADATAFVLPAGADTFGIVRDVRGKRFIINTGDGDNVVEVSVDPNTNQTYVTVDGVRHEVDRGVTLTVRTGGGQDVIRVPADYRVGLTVLSGDGGDNVTTGAGADRVYSGAGPDTVSTGAGTDRISTGAGDDLVMSGAGDDVVKTGDGIDIVYALGGDDVVVTGAGDDYVDGGTGNDLIVGGDGQDVLSGGDGNDSLYGGQGEDVIYAGAGVDLIVGGDDGIDKAFGQHGEDTSDTAKYIHVELAGNPGDSIVVTGTPEFQERMASDIRTLASSPTGLRMLEEMDRVVREHGRSITIVEGSPLGVHPPNGSNAVTLQFMSQFRVWDVPPVVALFHEFGHVYADANNVQPPGYYHGPDPVDNPPGDYPDPGPADDPFKARRAPIRERTVIGLPIDHDGDPNTPDEYYTPHPPELAQHRLEDEMNLERRPSFNFPPR